MDNRQIDGRTSRLIEGWADRWTIGRQIDGTTGRLIDG